MRRVAVVLVSGLSLAAFGSRAPLDAQQRPIQVALVGIVNYAASLHGVQVGLVNNIRQGGAFPVFPILNRWF